MKLLKKRELTGAPLQTANVFMKPKAQRLQYRLWDLLRDIPCRTKDVFLGWLADGEWLVSYRTVSPPDDDTTEELFALPTPTPVTFMIALWQLVDHNAGFPKLRMCWETPILCAATNQIFISGAHVSVGQYIVIYSHQCGVDTGDGGVIFTGDDNANSRKFWLVVLSVDTGAILAQHSGYQYDPPFPEYDPIVSCSQPGWVVLCDSESLVCICVNSGEVTVIDVGQWLANYFHDSAGRLIDYQLRLSPQPLLPLYQNTAATAVGLLTAKLWCRLFDHCSNQSNDRVFLLVICLPSCHSADIPHFQSISVDDEKSAANESIIAARQDTHVVHRLATNDGLLNTTGSVEILRNPCYPINIIY